MAQRPAGTYVSQVINPGIDKNIPLGAVDVVFTRDGEAVGFMRDGEFYELGDKPKTNKKKKASGLKGRGQYLNELDTKMIEAQDAINAARYDINSSEPGSDAFIKATNELDIAQNNYETLQEEYNNFVKKETSQKLQSEVKRLETEKKRKIALNESTESVDAKINKAKERISAASTISSEERRPSLAGITGGEMPKGGTAGGAGGKGGKGTAGVTSGKGPATTTAAKPGKKEKAPKYTVDQIYSMVQSTYGPIDLTFKTDPELRDLLFKAIGSDAKPGTKDDYTAQRFLNELQQTKWWQSNAGELRQRQFYKNQYDEMRRTADPATVARLDQTTEYGRGLANAKQAIADAAKQFGATVGAEELDMLARQIYDLGYENKPALVGAAIRGKIKYTPGGVLGGAAGEALRTLETTAAANGIDLQRQFGNNLQGWLQNINQGESVETYKQIIRERAKLGLPDKVASLVDRGVDLETIYDPYKQMMAAVLEINPETIKLDDPTLRMAIGPDKEMSLFDYQRTLRKDPRWQYTNNARQEVSTVAQQVLRDFGFQG